MPFRILSMVYTEILVLMNRIQANSGSSMKGKYKYKWAHVGGGLETRVLGGDSGGG